MSFNPSQHPRGASPANRGQFSERARPDSGVHLEAEQINPDDYDQNLIEVLESAARLQETVPDAVLVGGTAAVFYARHRSSYDHDHVLGDLRDRFDLVLEALEREGDWVTNRVTPGKIVLGQLGEIEAGVRQLIRTVPLEVREFRLPSGRAVRVPTQSEALRIKAFLIVKRNQVRDYLDVAALASRYGEGSSARTLSEIDRFYTDPGKQGTPVADQLVRQLAAPRPKDTRTIGRLQSYKALEPRWHDWAHVEDVLGNLSRRMVERDWEE